MSDARIIWSVALAALVLLLVGGTSILQMNRTSTNSAPLALTTPTGPPAVTHSESVEPPPVPSNAIPAVPAPTRFADAHFAIDRPRRFSTVGKNYGWSVTNET